MENKKTNSLLASVGTVCMILTSLGIILVALRNTITLHMENFWGASADFWQQRWDSMLHFADNDQFIVLVLGMYCLSYFTYWLGSAFYLFLDLTNWPAFMRRYKVQPGTNEPLDTAKLVKVIAMVNFNQLVTGTLTTWLSYRLMSWRGYDDSPKLPSFHRVLMELAVFVIMEEIGFYYTHRLLHHPSIYKYFHKMHHEWQSPVAPTAIYCHPAEFLFSNVSPGMLGPALTGCHMATLILWVQVQIIFTLHQHSGYHLPLMPSPEAHDFHHLKFNQCYGVLGILDMLHGTDDKFRASKCYSRDYVSFSFTPVRETVPDDHKKKL